MYIFPYLCTCARGIPHEWRRTDIRHIVFLFNIHSFISLKKEEKKEIIMPCLNARGLQSKLLITPLSE